MTRKILFVLLLLFIAAQLIPRPEKNVSAAVSAHDISTVFTLPDNVQSILKKSCNDCHSNNTHYPWYARIQPVAWWLGEHIEDGKKHLDFSEFGSYSLRKQYHKLEEVEEEVLGGGMPLGSYTFIHTKSKLSPEEKDLLVRWSQTARNEMKAKYPADSLARKK